MDELVSQQQGGDESVAALASQFRQHVQPLERKRSTWQKLAISWNTVVTWAAGRDSQDEIQLLLPMSESRLLALLWDAISVGASLQLLKDLVDAVQSRHGHYNLQKPVGDQGGYQ